MPLFTIKMCSMLVVVGNSLYIIALSPFVFSNDDTEEDGLSCDEHLNQSGNGDLDGDVFVTGGKEICNVEKGESKQR